MNFVAVDVETANADYSSICQIGIAEFENWELINKWSSLINPDDYFDPFNISIHGIKESDVKKSPTFDQVYSELQNRLSNKVTVHHMPFDRVAISRACEKYGLNILTPKWLDSAKVARRTWDEFAYRGFGLANLAEHLKITFGHHDALEDAIVAGKIIQEACKLKNLDLADWFDKTSRPISLIYSGEKLEGNPEGAFYGENIVFTGTLSMTRGEAAKLAADVGCNATNSVTKETTLLVVGTQDMSKLAGYEKSSKHRKAEELINKGLHIKILSEKDFKKMIEY